MAWADRAPHSLAALLCRAITRPPLGHDKVCGTLNFLLKPSQSVGRFKEKMPYCRRRLSWNSYHDKSVKLKRWSIALSQTPFSIVRRRPFIPTPSASSFRLDGTVFSAISLYFRPSALALRMQPLRSTYLRSVPPKSDPTKTSLAALEVLYARSSDTQGSGIPRPPRFTLWPRIYLSSALTSSPPKCAGKKASLRESYIGPITEPTPGTFLCRY